MPVNADLDKVLDKDYEDKSLAELVDAPVQALAGVSEGDADLLKQAFASTLPEPVLNRRDKMGFPVPLKEWFSADLKDFVQDMFRSEAARSRPFFHADAVLANFDKSDRFSRKTWGLMSLEIWHQLFHDRAAQIRAEVDKVQLEPAGAETHA